MSMVSQHQTHVQFAVVCRSCGGTGEHWFDYEDEHGRSRENMKPCRCEGADYGTIGVPACATCGVPTTEALHEADRMVGPEYTVVPDRHEACGCAERAAS